MAKQPVSEILDSVPPSDLDAEMAVLGSIVLNPDIRSELRFLRPGDFYSEANGVLFRVLMGMEVVDDVLLVATLRASGKLQEIGGLAYVSEVVQSVAVAAHAVHYGRIVRETALKRRMIHLNCEALKALYSGRWTAKHLAERQAERLRKIVSEE